MDVLVIGGAGVIGRFVTAELYNRGHDATVFDQAIPDFSGLDVDGEDVDYVEGDVRVTDQVTSAVEGVDAVIHLAALLPNACEADPSLAEQVNVGGTLNVLRAAADSDTRVLAASSKAVFGTIPGKYAHPTYQPIGEDASSSPTTVYGATKLACEHYSQAFARNFDLDVACFRFASTFGPGKSDAHGAYALLPQLIERSANAEPVSLSGVDESNDFIYYPDLAAGLVDAVEADRLGYDVYHLGSGQASPLRQFAEAVRERCSESEISMEGGLDFFESTDPRYCRMDITRARSDLGYDPEFTPEAAVEDYLTRLSES